MSDSSNHVRIIPSDRIKVGPSIGQGASGDVRGGSWRQMGGSIVVVAIKNIEGVNRGREIGIMNQCHHPRVVQLHGICTLNGQRHLITEYQSGGNLFEFLNRQDNKHLPWRTIRWQFAIDLAVGLQFLHGKEINHRDIKSPNIFVTKDLRLQIGDFDIAKQKTHTLTTQQEWAYTIPWAAPEVLSNQPPTFKSDIYSTGIVLWEIAALSEPYKGESPFLIPAKVLGGNRPSIPQACPKDFALLIRDCWSQQPQTRPTASVLLSRLNGMCPDTVGQGSLILGKEATVNYAMGEWCVRKGLLLSACRYLRAAAASKYLPAYPLFGYAAVMADAFGVDLGKNLKREAESALDQAYKLASTFSKHAQDPQKMRNYALCLILEDPKAAQIPKQGLKIMEQAAREGDEIAQFLVAMTPQCPPDTKLTYLSTTSAGGNVLAHVMLGGIYREGKCGVKQNMQLSDELYQRAIKSGLDISAIINQSQTQPQPLHNHPSAPSTPPISVPQQVPQQSGSLPFWLILAGLAGIVLAKSTSEDDEE